MISIKDIFNNYKCHYCYRAGLYNEWKDGKELSVCLVHLSNYAAD